MNSSLRFHHFLSGTGLTSGIAILIIASSALVFAQQPQQTATAQFVRSEPAAADSLSRSQPAIPDSSKSLSEVAPPARKPDSAALTLIPDGFVNQKLKRGESLSKLCAGDSLCQVIFMKVNRVDKRHIPVGKTVLLPIDVQKASRYVPVPELLANSRGEREIRIFLDRQYFGAYEKGRLLFWGPVSSGRKTYRTPPGKFFVNYKQRHKLSIKYDNAPMPFSINFYGGYFMHQQSLPGYPASHGCVRLLMTDAERLFNWVKPRDPVTVEAGA